MRRPEMVAALGRQLRCLVVSVCPGPSVTAPDWERYLLAWAELPEDCASPVDAGGKGSWTDQWRRDSAGLDVTHDMSRHGIAVLLDVQSVC